MILKAVFHAEQLLLFYGLTVMVEVFIHQLLGFKLLKHIKLLLLANFISVIFVYLLSQPLSSLIDFVILTFAVIVFEGFFIFKTFGKCSFWKALEASFLANLFSSIIGAYLVGLFF